MENNLENTVRLDTVDSVFEKIIKDRELKKYLEYKIGKTDFEIKDLGCISDLILNGKSITGKKNEVHFEVLELFSNLKKLEMKNLELSEEDIKRLKNIEDVSFRKCEIETLDGLENLRKLSIVEPPKDKGLFSKALSWIKDKFRLRQTQKDIGQEQNQKQPEDYQR